MPKSKNAHNNLHASERETILLFAACCLILAWAYFATFIGPYRRVEHGHMFEWFFTYEQGYVHRGLAGVIFQFVHGKTTIDKINAFLPIWETCILAVIVFLFWIMPVSRICLADFSRSTKWMLVAFAAVPLFFQGWKQFSEFYGFLDEWVLLFVLLAFVCFLFKRPFLYLGFVVPAFFFHPQAILYALVMAALIIHAVIRDQDYAARWRNWMLVALLPICVSAMLALLHSGETAHALINMNKQEILKIYPMDAYLFMETDYLTQGLSLAYLANSMRTIFAKGTFFIYFENMIPLLVYAFLFSRWCCKAMGGRPSFSITGHSFMRKVIPYECYILTICPLPLFFVASLYITDTYRPFYWAWFSMAIVSTYLIWFHARNRSKKSKNANNLTSAGSPRIHYLLAACMALYSYINSGMPANLFEPSGRHLTFYNEKHLYFPFNTNPLSDMYLGLIQKLHAMTVTTKTRISAQDMHNINARAENPYKMKNGRMEVPADYKGRLYTFGAQILGNQKMVVKVDYESKDPAPLVLAIGNQKIEPHYADDARAVWNLSVRDELDVVRILFEIHSSGGKDFKIISAEVDYEEL